MAEFRAYRAVRGLRRRCKNWREVADAIGAMSASYWVHVAQRTLKPSREAENALRARMGVVPKYYRRKPADWLWWVPVHELVRMIAERRVLP